MQQSWIDILLVLQIVNAIETCLKKISVLSHSQPEYLSEYLPIALYPFYIVCIKLFKRAYRQRICTWAMSCFSIHILAHFQLLTWYTRNDSVWIHNESYLFMFWRAFNFTLQHLYESLLIDVVFATLCQYQILVNIDLLRVSKRYW